MASVRSGRGGAAVTADAVPVTTTNFDVSRSLPGRAGDPQHPHDLPDALHPPAHGVDGLGQHLLQRVERVDQAQFGDVRGGVQDAGDDRVDHRVLVREDPEDRALGDAGGLGDLPGGDGGAVVADQRDRGGDDRGPAFVGRQRGCSGGWWCHGGTVAE